MTQNPPAAQTALALGVARISGRIEARRRTRDGKAVDTLLKLPAADSFSMPAVIEVRSKEPIGKPGDLWDGKVLIGGYPRSYDSKQVDDEDGRVTTVTVQTANITLHVVE